MTPLDLTTMHVMAFMYLTLADIDNNPTEEEMKLAITKLKEWGNEDLERVDNIIKDSFEWYMKARDENRVGAELENNLYVFNDFNENQKKAILNDMIIIIKADGDIDPKETKFFGVIAECLGIDLG